MKAATANSEYTGNQLNVTLELGDAVRLENDAAIAFVSDPQKLQQLAPFLQDEVTVSQVAVQLKLTQNAAYKLVRTLERLGLVRLTREQRRAGKSVKFYRVVAQRISVASDRLSLGQLIELRHARYWERMQRIVSRTYYERDWEDRQWSFVVDRTHQGQLFLRPFYSDGRAMNSLEDAQPAVFNGWIELRLTPAQAKAMQRDVYELLRRYDASTTGQRYLFGLFMGEERE
jgi:DNA-binding transcriptional ArsR family regulator